MRPLLFCMLLLAVGSSSAAAPRKPPVKAGKTASAPSVPKVMQSCDAHKFEALVDVTVDGQPRKSKVKLCGVEGQSDAAWMDTLRDAVRKLEANKAMPVAQRDQIITAIKSEIARLSIVQKPAVTSAAGPILSGPEANAPPSSLARDYAALPPLPPPLASPVIAAPIVTAPTVAAPAGTERAPTEMQAVTPTPPVAAAPSVRSIANIAKLSFTCFSPSSLRSDGPCDEFERETVLTVRASGPIPPGATLRFVRNGEDRANVDLAPLTRAKSMSLPMPKEVCAGFGAGRLELQVVVGGSVSTSERPTPLRCY